MLKSNRSLSVVGLCAQCGMVRCLRHHRGSGDEGRMSTFRVRGRGMSTNRRCVQEWDLGVVVAGAGAGSVGEVLDRCPNKFFIRAFVDFSWCSPRMCIFSSARELSVDVPILFLSLVSVVPNSLNNRSQIAEFALYMVYPNSPGEEGHNQVIYFELP